MTESPILLLHESLAGHRADYLKLFNRLFEESGFDVEQRRLSFGDVLYPGPIFSTMLEEHPMRFAVVAALRALMGKRSVTLIFRPVEAATGRSMRLRAKRLALSLLKRSRRVSVLSILPFDANPAIARSATGWIYDPQFWDVPLGKVLPPPPIDLASLARGRKIVCALGTQNEQKGFDLFCRLWADHADIRDRYLFVAAGKVTDSLKDTAEAFMAAGGVVLNRFISDDELLGLYGASDLVWCCYAPNYDQASGIFGRAIQLGRTPIIRAGSLVDRLSRNLSIPAIAVSYEPQDAASILAEASLAKPRTIDVAAMREDSSRSLFAALGVVMGSDRAKPHRP